MFAYSILTYIIALTPMKIKEFFTPIINLAKQLKSNIKKLSVKTAQEPLITVSCLNKELSLFLLDDCAIKCNVRTSILKNYLF